jgi:hypothetical protein
VHPSNNSLRTTLPALQWLLKQIISATGSLCLPTLYAASTSLKIPRENGTRSAQNAFPKVVDFDASFPFTELKFIFPEGLKQ